ncbi:complement factor H-like [Trematomus bernacchii]|uniref:complement factor H-like n=1 Tax=Trematomus bernacchii TaxID=40690 RepID=UPI00146D9F22|nr:complement factor H-like [Trematomus bernacchii]
MAGVTFQKSLFLLVYYSTEIICTAPEIENGDVLGQIQEYIENQVLEFQCKPSFRRAEARSSKCTEQGVRAEWSPTPLCEPITCKLQLPGLKGTSYEPASRNTFLPGDQVTVNCEDKYWIFGYQPTSVVTTCKEDGEWTIRPLCQEVTCSKQGVPHVSSWDSRWQQTFKSGETTRYGCETGYRRKDGASRATCTRDGWQPNPLCEEIICTAPEIENGDVLGQIQEYKENQVLEFQCKPSFRRAEARSSKCTEQGVRAEWSPTPLCEPITCKLQLPGLKGTSYEPAYRNTFLPGDEVTVNCGDKYWISRHQQASVVTTCKEDGEWTIRPLCQEVTCSTQGVPHVSSWDSRRQQTFKSGETTRYGCETGYRRKDGASRATCTRDGWQPNPLCEEIICTAPEIENGDVLGQIQEYIENQVLEFQCKPSFRRAEARSSKCTKQGVRAEWSPTPLCESITCKLQLPGLKGTSYEPAYRNTFLPGDQVTVTCEDKYWISRHQPTSVVTTCKEGGEWTIRPLCQESHCKKPHIDGANFIGVVRESYSLNDRIRYACKNNVEIIVTITCEENGWNGIQSCSEVLGCGTAPIIADGDLKYTRKSNNSHNDMVEYMCQAYYTMEGEPYKTCVNGVWTGHTRCIQPCTVNEDDNKQHNITVKYNGSTYFTHDEIIEFRCARGIPVGSVSLLQRCNSGVIVLPTCQEF